MRASIIVSSIVAGALALAGCAPADPAVGPTATPPSGSPTVSPSMQSIAVGVYFAHPQASELTLISEERTLELPGDEPVLDSVLDLLVGGVLQPLDPDYTTLWDGASVLDTRRAGDVLTLDLTGVSLNVGAEAEGIAIAQLVWTAIAVDPSLTAVQLMVDGVVPETLAGHVDTTAPILPAAPESVLTPVQITAPLEGGTVMNPVTATGLACVFEATVQWRLDGPDGAVVEGSTMATEACPTRAPWLLDLGDLAPGEYLLTVIEISPKDGSIASTDSKSFTVIG